MDPRTYLKPQAFMSRLNKYAVNSYYVDLVKRKGNLRDILIQARIASSRKTITELFSDPEAWNKGLTEVEKKQSLEKMIASVDKREAEEVDKFFITLLNQTLVMLCTVFDTYLVDCFDVITYAKPDLLKSFANDKDISIGEVIDGKTYDNVFNSIQGKVLRRFDFAGIEDKFKYLQQAGMETKVLFTLNNIMSPKHQNPLGEIIKVYNDRNDIVHRNKMKISKYEEISHISDLMTHLIMHWGTLEFKKKFKIDSDFILMSQGKLLPNND